MKKLSSFLAVLFVCMIMCSCSAGTGEPRELPDIPRSLYAVTEITPASMAELESKVSRLTAEDFLHPDRIAMFENLGINISITNILLKDCNTITFDIVLSKKFGSRLVLPATGMLMYQYLPWNESYIAGLQVLWGNLSIYDDLIVLANVDILSFWHSDTFEQVFRQPDMSFTREADYFFILDAVKNKDGYLLPYFSSNSSGFINLALSGKVIDTPLQYTSRNSGPFGTYKLMESRNFNTTARADTRLHCFYSDEAEQQIFISHDYEYEYSGSKYRMYDFEKDEFVSSHTVATYNMPPYRYDIYGMCIDKAQYEDTVFLAEKTENGGLVEMVTFEADINPFEFGTDMHTGWNTHTHINLSEDMNVVAIGCDKNNTVMNIDFASDTAEIINTSRMPQMLGVDNSPNSMHMLYRTHSKDGTSLMVRILSGNCRMDHITDVTGRWGVNWLAGFYSHDSIYVLTEKQFRIFSWEGTNYWQKTADMYGSYAVNMDTVNSMCSAYA